MWKEMSYNKFLNLNQQDRLAWEREDAEYDELIIEDKYDEESEV